METVHASPSQRLFTQLPGKPARTVGDETQTSMTMYDLYIIYLVSSNIIFNGIFQAKLLHSWVECFSMTANSYIISRINGLLLLWNIT